MTYWKNDPRTLALADNTTATSGNVPAPDGFSPITSGSSTIKFRTSGGNLGEQWELNGVAGVARGDIALSSAQFACEFMFDLGASAPSTDNILLTLNAASGARVVHTTAGLIAVYDNSGGFAYQTPSACTGRTRIFFSAKTGSTAGELHLKVYTGADADGTTATYTYDATNKNNGTINFPHVRFGKVGSGGTVLSRMEYGHLYDDRVTNTGLGPLGAGSPPTADAGPDQLDVEPWTVVTLDGSASFDDVGVTSYTWTQTAGTAVTLSGSGATRTFTVPGSLSGETFVFQLEVADADGGTDTDSVTVTSLPASERIMIGGSWVPARIRPVP